MVVQAASVSESVGLPFSWPQPKFGSPLENPFHGEVSGVDPEYNLPEREDDMPPIDDELPFSWPQPKFGSPL